MIKAWIASSSPVEGWGRDIMYHYFIASTWYYEMVAYFSSKMKDVAYGLQHENLYTAIRIRIDQNTSNRI